MTFSQTFMVGLNTPVTSALLGFWARSIRVDNPSSNWLTFADGSQVAPYTMGRIISLRIPATTAIISTTPPSGLTVLDDGNKATVVYTDEVHPETSGVSVIPFRGTTPVRLFLIPAAQITNSASSHLLSPPIAITDLTVTWSGLDNGATISITIGGPGSGTTGLTVQVMTSGASGSLLHVYPNSVPSVATGAIDTLSLVVWQASGVSPTQGTVSIYITPA